MVLTRQEKEKLVLDLHNQRQPIRVIAKEAGMSFRDIGPIIDKEEKDKETKEAQVRRGAVSSQAYNLFSAGKTPVQVAVELNLGQLEVTRLYREYWNLVQLDNLNKIYKEIADDIWFFVELYRIAKAAGMDPEHVLRLLRIANNYLPSVEERYEKLKGQEDLLQLDNTNSARIFQDLSDQVVALGKRLDSYCISCQEEEAKLKDLQQKKMKLEAVVKYFENYNEEYLKIGKKVEEELIRILSNPKVLLMSALWALVKSMRNDPTKFSSLIYYNTSAAAINYNGQRKGFSYIQRQPQEYFSKGDFTRVCASMLIEEADELFADIAKEFLDKISTEYCDHERTSSLPSLPSPEEE